MWQSEHSYLELKSLADLTQFDYVAGGLDIVRRIGVLCLNLGFRRGALFRDATQGRLVASNKSTPTNIPEERRPQWAMVSATNKMQQKFFF